MASIHYIPVSSAGIDKVFSIADSVQDASRYCINSQSTEKEVSRNLLKEIFV